MHPTYMHTHLYACTLKCTHRLHFAFFLISPQQHIVLTAKCQQENCPSPRFHLSSWGLATNENVHIENHCRLSILKVKFRYSPCLSGIQIWPGVVYAQSITSNFMYLNDCLARCSRAIVGRANIGTGKHLLIHLK